MEDDQLKKLKEMMKSVVHTINLCTKSQLEEYLNKITENAIIDLKKTLDDAYYNDISLTDDWKYDMIKDRVELSRGEIGAPLHEKEVKVKLPIWLGSLDKIKSDESSQKEMSKWIKKFGNDVMIMDKLDGVSCLYIFEKKENKVSLYTRGDGKEGKDISYITNHIHGLPDPKKHQSSLMVRGELVIAKRHNVQCSRNIVNGAVKGKKVTNHLKMVTFVAHEYITTTSSENNIFLNVSEQIRILKDADFHVVYSEISDIQNLSRLLRSRLEVSEYDIDGIVVHSLKEKFFSRNVDKNPEYSFAYKEDQYYTAEVTDVKWSVSKAKLLKPVVHICPINILGATVSCASGYNAKFIVDNRIGKGATILITRSGEVIPKIVEIIRPSSDDQLVYPSEKYDWNDTKVEFVLQDDDENIEVKAKKLVHFAKVLGIKHLGPSTADKLISAGIDTVDTLLMCKKEDFTKLEAFKDLSVDRLYNNIHESWKTSSIEMKMHASCCFPDGLGIKNFSEILKNPNLLTDDNKKVAVHKYKIGYPVFALFMHRIGETISHQNVVGDLRNSESNNDGHNNTFLFGKKIVFSGFRDANLSARIAKLGATVTSTVSGKTDILIVTTLENSSSKISKAKELGVQVMVKDEFVSKI